MISQRIEEYLESIFKIEESGEQATVTKIANYLSISPPSVSEMIKKLNTDGYLDVNAKKISLSNKGGDIAIKVIRRHRLSERLLTDMLGMDWESAHDKACELEHVITEEIADRIDENLRFPKTCPHGYPIPDKNGNVTGPITIKLSELNEGSLSEIVSVPEENEEILRHLSSIGVLPNSAITMNEAIPFSGTLSYSVNSKNINLSKEIAEKVRVLKPKN